jgi:hypothetical protein
MKKLRPDHILVGTIIVAAVAVTVAVWNLLVWVPV